MKTHFRTQLIGIVSMVLFSTVLSGCFTMKHGIPMDAYFNQEPAGNARTTSFENTRMKNYLLSGLFPYSRFGTKNMVEVKPGRKITGLEIQSQFNEFDFFVTLIPGLAYGYYIWAPRHVSVKGQYMDGDVPKTIPARSITNRTKSRRSYRR